MQKINKNEKGVTLIALTVTIIILFILAGISIQYGVAETKTIKNKKFESELSIVQEAVMQRYALVKSQNSLGIRANPIDEDKRLEDDDGRPAGFSGTRLASSSILAENGFEDVEPVVTYNAGADDKKYEEYYYLLDENDLAGLGIKKGKNKNPERIYIVNYSTGEIFDITNKKYYFTRTQNADPVYTRPSINTTSEKVYDFNDD